MRKTIDVAQQRRPPVPYVDHASIMHRLTEHRGHVSQEVALPASWSVRMSPCPTAT